MACDGYVEAKNKPRLGILVSTLLVLILKELEKDQLILIRMYHLGSNPEPFRRNEHCQWKAVPGNDKPNVMGGREEWTHQLW